MSRSRKALDRSRERRSQILSIPVSGLSKCFEGCPRDRPQPSRLLKISSLLSTLQSDTAIHHFLPLRPICRYPLLLPQLTLSPTASVPLLSSLPLPFDISILPNYIPGPAFSPVPPPAALPRSTSLPPQVGKGGTTASPSGSPIPPSLLPACLSLPLLLP